MRKLEIILCIILAALILNFFQIALRINRLEDKIKKQFEDTREDVNYIYWRIDNLNKRFPYTYSNFFVYNGIIYTNFIFNIK